MTKKQVTKTTFKNTILKFFNNKSFSQTEFLHNFKGPSIKREGMYDSHTLCYRNPLSALVEKENQLSKAVG